MDRVLKLFGGLLLSRANVLGLLTGLAMWLRNKGWLDLTDDQLNNLFYIALGLIAKMGFEDAATKFNAAKPKE